MCFIWCCGVAAVLAVYVIKLGGVISVSEGDFGEVGSGVVPVFGGVSGVMVVSFS